MVVSAECDRQARLNNFARRANLENEPSVVDESLSEVQLLNPIIFSDENETTIPSGHDNWTEAQLKTVGTNF